MTCRKAICAFPFPASDNCIDARLPKSPSRPGPRPSWLLIVQFLNTSSSFANLRRQYFWLPPITLDCFANCCVKIALLIHAIGCLGLGVKVSHTGSKHVTSNRLRNSRDGELVITSQTPWLFILFDSRTVFKNSSTKKTCRRFPLRHCYVASIGATKLNSSK